MKVKSESKVTQLCPTLSNPMDCSLPGSSIHGIFQARVPECGAITVHSMGLLKFKSCVLSTYVCWETEVPRVNLFVMLMTSDLWYYFCKKITIG